MEIFCHHIYEFRKGIRDLVLYTAPEPMRTRIEHKLNNAGIPYVIHSISENKINVYFGDPHCVETIRAINKPCLGELSDEEDFILGAMLGYDIVLQCKRYMDRRDSRRLAG